MAANITHLEHACNRILAEIEGRQELITPSFRRLCSFVRRSVEEALEAPETLAADAASAKADQEAAAAKALTTSPSGSVVPADSYLTPALKVLSSFFFLRYAVPGEKAHTPCPGWKRS